MFAIFLIYFLAFDTVESQRSVRKGKGFQRNLRDVNETEESGCSVKNSWS
jgi:hypothetical protein